MSKTTRLLCLIIFLVTATSACSSVQLPKLAPSGPTATVSKVLFQDDFSTRTGGWVTLNEDGKVIDYEGYRFHIVVGGSNVDYWSTPGLSFSDTQIEVDAAKNGGPDDNDYGILCRYQDENNFYGLLISSDGYYGISKMKDGEHTIIGTDGMKFSEAIRKGADLNHIQADCVGNTLRLAVNGKTLAEVQDNDFSKGDIGLVAGTFDTPGTDVFFDNLVVAKPEN